LYLEVAFRPRTAGSPNYRIDKHDVYLDLPITPWEAAVGAQVQAPTPSGAVEVTIPPESSSGRKLRLKGRGIPGSTPGDFYFVLQLVTPPAQTASDKFFYADMARQFESFKPRVN
jgi:curved DNA-binding protein